MLNIPNSKTKRKQLMIRKNIVSFCLVCFLFLALASQVYADTVVTDWFSIAFNTNESFAYQDIFNSITLNFTVADGSLNGSAQFNTNDYGGTLIINPSTTGTLRITPSSDNIILSVNSAHLIGGLYGFTAGSEFTVSWTYTAVPTSTPSGLRPDILNVQPFWQYLFTGNLWGFFLAIFSWSFIVQDIFWGCICALFLVPIYIRTKSLLLVCVLWILLGGFFITAMPAVSGLAIVFLILGIGGVLWKLVRPN